MTTAADLRIVHAACPHDCPDACAMLVHVRDGVATAVRGDRSHPFTRGALCAKVNDYERRAYSPGRVLHPMRRVGPKGAGEFERISWDDAVAEVAANLRRVTEAYGPEAVLPVSFTGNLSILNGMASGDAFMHRLGATVLERTMCISARSTAWIATVGPAVLDPESVARSRYLVIWGSNTLSTNQHLWHFVQQARDAGGKVVVIDPYRTRTAALADWFVPIRPGTDGALALGLAHVLFAAGLVDEEWARAHTVGLDDLAARAAEFDPERVAKLTGVPAADVRRLARELATEQPSMINVGVAVERSPSGGQAMRAIFCLPALTGSWRHVGGGALEMPLWAFPVRWDAFSKPEWIREGTRVLNHMHLGRALTGRLPLDPPLQALVVYNGNPAVHLPESRLVREGLAREDLFTVVHDMFVTDTARYPDIVLPATTGLEHLDLTYSWGHCYVQWNSPAISPCGEAVPNTELFRRLAAAMGFDDPWFSLSDEQLAAEAIDWSAPGAAGMSLELLREQGWARVAVPGADAAAAPYADGGFPTPSGRVELRSSLIEQAGAIVLPFFREGYTGGELAGPVGGGAAPPTDPLPSWEAPPETARWPLTLVNVKAHAFLNSQYANQERQREREGPQPVLVNEADAHARGVATGDTVRLVNELGSVTAIAEVRPDLVAGTVVCTYGRWSDGGGPTLNAVVRADLSEFAHAPLLSGTSVELELERVADAGLGSRRA